MASLFPLSSPIDALREYLSRMDIEMIDLILDDSNTYNDVKKELFLEKLNEIFDEFKVDGDTQLKIFRGECSNCFKHCRGYTLLGNHTQNYLDIVVKEEDGEIKDIFHCSELVNYQDFEKMDAHLLYFDEVESDPFKEDGEYLILVHHCQNAYQEWEAYRKQTISIQTMEEWVVKHNELFESCFPYLLHSGHDDFFLLYCNMKNLCSLYKKRELVVNEVMGLKKIIQNGCIHEDELLQWLIRNETYLSENNIQISECVESKSSLNGHILLNADIELYIQKSVFEVFFIYENFYTKYYKEKLDEYRVCSQYELEHLDPESMDYCNACSLKYNLELRKSGLAF